MDSLGEWGGAPLPPFPLPGRAERARVCSDKWHINGAPGKGEARLPDAGGYPRGGASHSPKVGGPESSLPAGASFSASEKWVLSQEGAPHPRICRLVLGSGDPGQDPPGGRSWHAGAQHSHDWTPAEVAPEGAPRSNSAAALPGYPSLGLPRKHPLRAAPPAAPRSTGRLSAKKKAWWVKYIHIYISLQRRDPAGKGQRAPRAARGRGGGRTARSLVRTRAWPQGVVLPLPSGRRMRVSLLRGNPRPEVPGPMLSAEAASGAPSPPSSGGSSPRTAWSGLSFPDCKPQNRLQASSLPGFRGDVIAMERSDWGFGPDGRIRALSPLWLRLQLGLSVFTRRESETRASSPAPGPALDPRRAEGAKAGGGGGKSAGRPRAPRESRAPEDHFPDRAG